MVPDRWHALAGRRLRGLFKGGGHLGGISAVTIEHEGCVDFRKIEQFIGSLLLQEGPSSSDSSAALSSPTVLYRSKGILAIATDTIDSDSDSSGSHKVKVDPSTSINSTIGANTATEFRNLAFHSVHGMFQGDFMSQSPIDGVAPSSRLVFIGQGLDKDALEAGVRECSV